VGIETRSQEDTMSTLIELNALRIANNLKPLKGWKESNAKLTAAIAKLSKITPAEQALKASVEVTKIPAGMTAAKLAAAKEKAAKAKPSDPVLKKGDKIAASKKTDKQPVAKKPAIEGVSVSTIATKLGIDPKVARAKLRRAFGDADGSGKDGSRWVFSDTKAKEVEAILKGDARKKA
jgi:hypothetical protein